MLMALVLGAAAVPAVCAGVREPIVDVHVHTYERDARFDARTPNPGDGGAMTAFTGADHARATAEALRRAGVVRAVVGGRTRATDERLVALDPERLRFGFKVDALPTPADLAAIRSLHAAGKLAMIGEVDYQYEGIRHDDPGLEPLWALAEELGVPIAVHSGAGPAGIIYHGEPRHRARIGDPSSFEEVLVRHPRMKLIVMHAGFPFFENMVALMQAYPQVHVDIGAIDWADPAPGFHDYLRRLVTYGYGRRVLFGSDQMVWPQGVALAIARVRQATYLTAAQRRDILFGNAVRLFGWTDLEACGRSY
jgi:uncharacterized protein